MKYWLWKNFEEQSQRERQAHGYFSSAQPLLCVSFLALFNSSLSEVPNTKCEMREVLKVF